MNEEKRIQIKLNQGKLLNEKGELNEKGYSNSLIKEYNRNEIKAPSYRIKEWDYYFISNGEIGLALTFGDIGYIGNASVTLFNFDTSDIKNNPPNFKTKSDLTFFPFGKFKFPNQINSNQILEYNSSKIKLKFQVNDETTTNDDGIINRHLTCDSPNFDGNGNNLKVDLNLKIPSSNHSSMVIATPFKGYPNAFYYNCKINNMITQGTIKLNDKLITFDSNNSLGVLDWGRGVWPFEVITWYWGSLSCKLDDGRLFGFNIGYGFGDTTAATENMIYLDSTSHKIDEVEFIIPSKSINGKHEHDYMADWKFISNDNRLQMDFKPILNRSETTNLLIIQSNTNQVFGKFSGTAILDDGTIINFKDKLGFAEKVTNKW